MKLLIISFVTIELLCFIRALPVPEDKLKCEVEGNVGQRVRISPQITCICRLVPSGDEVFLDECMYDGSNKVRRQGFPTPAPPTTTVKYSTNSPPPFSTRSPPPPRSTQGPTKPTTHGITLAPPPIG